MTGPLRIEPLKDHDRTEFDCGVPALDRYMREHAMQDMRRRVSNCFVALDLAGRIAGYYTFAAAGLPLADLPEIVTRRLPRYPLLPAGLVGRLAVDAAHRGRGLGVALVMDAARRAAGADPAIFALIVDAKDEPAARFYVHLGFARLASRPSSLLLPVATAVKAMGAG